MWFFIPPLIHTNPYMTFHGQWCPFFLVFWSTQGQNGWASTGMGKWKCWHRTIKTKCNNQKVGFPFLNGSTQNDPQHSAVSGDLSSFVFSQLSGLMGGQPTGLEGWGKVAQIYHNKLQPLKDWSMILKFTHSSHQIQVSCIGDCSFLCFGLHWCKMAVQLTGLESAIVVNEPSQPHAGARRMVDYSPMYSPKVSKANLTAVVTILSSVLVHTWVLHPTTTQLKNPTRKKAKVPTQRKIVPTTLNLSVKTFRKLLVTVWRDWNRQTQLPTEASKLFETNITELPIFFWLS